jgi:methylenetetrahydrofolate dehydrogenase (NADP+)/methenyltetrahydrofolate cyclohydrolase
MTAKLLDGKALATQLRKTIQQQIHAKVAQGWRSPTLAVVLIGQDPASQIYVRNKRIACSEVGIISQAYDLPEDTSTEKLLTLLTQLNEDDRVDGILVQLPLPSHIDSSFIIEQIIPQKDVDGFHPYNVGCLALRMPALRPCTPKGIMKLLAHTEMDLTGLEAVVVGDSAIVGRPMALELSASRCTVTLCHDKTRDLAAKVHSADIVVSAVGKPHLIVGDWIKPNAIVIDVGINRLLDGRLVGDIDFPIAQQHASWITPVPGGVGPMTVACLLENTFISYQLALETKKTIG